MAEHVIFHGLVQRDMDEIRRYYIDEADEHLADRFYFAFLSQVEKALANPEGFHLATGALRRANIPKFPYHFLFRRIRGGIRVLVLRHEKRHPAFGLRRK